MSDDTPSVMEGWPVSRRNTIRDLQAATDRGERWAMLTSYDAFTAALFEEAGVRALLVGDTAGMVVFGRENTVSVTLDELIPLVGAVVAATKRALVVADLPFGSYQGSVGEALHSALRYVKETGAQAVKLEGGRSVLPQVRAIVEAGIPLMAHLGLTPQSIHALGGHRVQGRGHAGERLLEDALALEEAGAFAVVLEAVPAELGEKVTSALRIPTIGIGAGAGCAAQILVWQDMLGLTPGRVPKFVKKYADLQAIISESARSYVAEVRDGKFPDSEHSY
jgi:3-methyl-2-oxobutanoate hydroxymethyltransferase